MKPWQCVSYRCGQYFVDLQNKCSSRLPYGDVYLPLTKVLQARVVPSRSGPVMELKNLQAASALSPSSTSRPTSILHSGATSQLPLSRAALERAARSDDPDEASIGIDTCGWYEGVYIRDSGPAWVGLMAAIQARRSHALHQQRAGSPAPFGPAASTTHAHRAPSIPHVFHTTTWPV